MVKRLIFLAALLLLSVVNLTAQNFVTYGSATVTNLSAAAPVAIFTFQGTANDQVTIQGISITPGLDLSATVQNGAEILAVAQGDPFAASPDDVRADLLLPTTGTYIVIITSSNGSTGDFLFKINGQPADQKTIITGIPADVPINAGETSYYSYTGTPDETTILNLNAQSPDLQFLAVIRNNTGQIIGTSSGSSVVVNLNGAGPFEIALTGVTSSMAGTISVTLGATQEPPEATPTETTEQDIPEPIVTEEVADNTGECVVSANNVVNVRFAPTTDAPIRSTLSPGQNYTVVARTTQAGGWYEINLPDIGGTAWVFSGVVTLSGDCSAVPYIDNAVPTAQATATSAPTVDNQQQQQPTATFTPSYTPTVQQQQQQATATFTPSYTPTVQQQPTATFTPSYTPTTQPAPQLAPEDARFNNPLNIPLDNTVSVLDFVSYPGGDTEDRVRYDITGMNQNSSVSGGRARLVISVSCFGDGTDQIQFFTGGQTYSCGQTLVDQEVTFNSKTGSVVITAVGGSNTYVQWVLTGTATRVN